MPTNYIDKIITTDNTEYVISVDLNNVQNADDLKAIEGISGTSGLLKKTAIGLAQQNRDAANTTDRTRLV